MRKNLRGNFFATAIGSVPHHDEGAVCKKILRDYRDIPFWPQMPKRSFFENMYAQFLEGFPCAVIDEGKKKLWIDTSKDMTGELETAYQKILDEDCEYFAITQRHAAGFHEFVSQLKNRKDLTSIFYVKGQVTGPISFGLTVTDEKKQSILYHPELSEVLVKILAIKARFQIKRLKEVFEDIIIFIDEPYLVSIGSSVVNIQRDDVSSKIEELAAAIHQEGALCGIHCCGNTDWSLLLDSDIDILSFDAYNFSKSISLYPDELKKFLKKEKILAWGIIPTSEDIKNESSDTLIERLEKGFSLLIDKGIGKDMILNSVMVTPSCGCGTMDVEDAEKVLDLNIKISDKLREIYGR